MQQPGWPLDDLGSGDDSASVDPDPTLSEPGGGAWPDGAPGDIGLDPAEPDPVQGPYGSPADGSLEQEPFGGPDEDPATDADSVDEPDGPDDPSYVPLDPTLAPGDDTPEGGGDGPGADGVYGDPESDSTWAQTQSEDGFCAPVSVGMIISELTGSVHGEAELVTAAQGLGVLGGEPGAWTGMTVEGTVELLEHYGVEAHAETGTLDSLAQYLEEGRNIVVAVDSDEVWTATDDDASSNDAGVDHAVVITGIDTDRGVVILNDPGQQDGEGFEIPIEQFEDSWTDGGNAMVVTDGPTEGADFDPTTTTPTADDVGPTTTESPTEALPTAAGDPSDVGSAGLVLLPVTLVAAHLIRRASR